MFNSKRIVKDVSAPLGNVSNSTGSAAANQAKLDVAKRLASKINMQRNLGAGTQVSSFIFQTNEVCNVFCVM